MADQRDEARGVLTSVLSQISRAKRVRGAEALTFEDRLQAAIAQSTEAKDAASAAHNKLQVMVGAIKADPSTPYVDDSDTVFSSVLQEVLAVLRRSSHTGVMPSRPLSFRLNPELVQRIHAVLHALQAQSRLPEPPSLASFVRAALLARLEADEKRLGLWKGSV